jgi:hypothetical protein
MEKVFKNSELLREASVIDGRSDSDTIRVWESYREQANLWRALLILQLPVTIAALVFAAVIFINRSIQLNVPRQPLPGMYTVQEVDDAEFINVATDFVNLIASYQPTIVDRQFNAARNYLWGSFLAKFDAEMMVDELRAIKATSRTQVFLIDPTRTEVLRQGKEVKVTFAGDRIKIIAGKESPLIQSKFSVTMTTVPRNRINPTGIVITNVKYESGE